MIPNGQQQPPRGAPAAQGPVATRDANALGPGISSPSVLSAPFGVQALAGLRVDADGTATPQGLAPGPGSRETRISEGPNINPLFSLGRKSVAVKTIGLADWLDPFMIPIDKVEKNVITT